VLFQGIAAAPGLAIAPCLKINPIATGEEPQTISIEQAPTELERFTAAVALASAQLETIAEAAKARGDQLRVDIVEAQSMMLLDPVLAESVAERISGQLYSAPHAVRQVIEEQAAILAALEDEYLRERAGDVRDIGGRLLACLYGQSGPELTALTAAVILVAVEITPSLLASADPQKVIAIVAETGGKTSHAAILAKNMAIPAVLGCQGILATVTDGELFLVDGNKGQVETGLTAERLAAARQENERSRAAQQELTKLIGQPTSTLDGFHIELAANIMDPKGAAQAVKVGADGVGLYRTEFLFMGRDSAPTEKEQFVAYRQVLETMAGKPVIIRTMDIGGDKEIPYMNAPPEANPFLGYRAIRICLQQPDLFMTQLRAILRASAYGKARIMYPMIASLEEVQAANRILQQAKQSLRQEGSAFDDAVPVGIMVEIPSAAVMADQLVDVVDFFSIGSNDLTQYTLAVDRLNAQVSQLYNPFQPGVLRLIRLVAEAAGRTGGAKFAGICGELAADPKATLLLLGLGVTELSVNPPALLTIKKIITSVSLRYAQEVADTALQLPTAAAIENYLEQALPAELRLF
jgi:phosphotransferase system enzyme I (PtsI)